MRIRTGADTAAQHLPANKVLWVLVVQAAVVVPHIVHLSSWIPVAALCTGLWRYHATRRQWRAPGLLLRTLLIGIGSIAVYVDYGTLFGRDAGVAMIVLMLALKLLELNRRRDVVVFLFLGYFLVVTNFLYSQSVPMALYMFLVGVLLTSALAAIHDPGWRVRPVQHIRLATVLLLQALPVTILLFLLFPRISGPLWSLPEDAYAGTSGLSDQMSPGSIARLVRSNEVAFRVDFSASAPPVELMYWRGLVFDRYDGHTWSSGSTSLERALPTHAVDRTVNYQVTLEATHHPWLLSLDHPLSTPAGATLTQDYVVGLRQPVRERIRYTMRSRVSPTQILEQPLTERQRRRALEFPDDSDPRTQALGRELAQQYRSNPQQIVDAVLRRFHQQAYVYTLQPPRLRTEDSIDEFLFETRSGFCEHYAGAFVALMRAAGIPSRVVAGYQGAEYNAAGDYWIVRQSDAHAWAEVWLHGVGWWRVDPTAAIAPERVESGIEAALPDQVSRFGFGRSDSSILREVGLLWDSMNNSWNQWVLGYGAEQQLAFLQQLGFNKPRWFDRALITAGAVTGALLLLAGTMALRNRPPRAPPAVRAYQTFCDKLARIGLGRSPFETPHDYACRVSALHPELQADVEGITRLYTRIRYQDDGSPEAVAALKRQIELFSPARAKRRTT